MPERKDTIDSKKMKALTKLGEEYVEHEIKNALLGIKQMKKIVEANENKHENMLKSLKKTTEEREEAVKLFEEINKRLSVAEAQCKDLLKSSWEVCKACLEKPCIMSYKITCAHLGFPEVATKVPDIFEEWSPFTAVLQKREVTDLSESTNKQDNKLIQADESFNQMMSDVSNIFNQSIQFFRNLHQVFDRSFQRLFLKDMKFPSQEIPINEPSWNPVKNTEFTRHLNMSGWMQTFSDFSQAVFEGVTNVVFKMVKEFTLESKGPFTQQAETARHLEDLKSEMICEKFQNDTGCLQFQERCQTCYETWIKDCPDVPELLRKSEAAFKLVNMSSQQYEDLVHVVQQHTEDTVYVVTHMKEQFGWVADNTNLTYGSDHIFSIEKVSISTSSEYPTLNETIVEVNVLSAPTFTIRVPPAVDVESPQFMPYVAEKALEIYKNNF
uniref:Clusterin n=2 Tax=Leptobrachium leishanense TaxID=445787 RepID=A0A8C5WDZ7_9ANUR